MLEGMEDLQRRIEANRVERDRLSAEMHKMIVDAYSEGNSVAFIARTLGISRQTVYTSLREV